jgi:uncharacterized membrane protein
MFFFHEGVNKLDLLFVLLNLALIALLLLLPTGFEERVPKNTMRARGAVVETADSEVQQLGIVKVGIDLVPGKEEIVHVNIIDHYRIHIEILLFGVFTLLLLLYAGWTGLKALIIFLIGGLQKKGMVAFLGAAMDIAMDISASMNEVVQKHRHIHRKDLIQSGFTVGRTVIGTMTTTLLLAYTDGFTTMIMVFIAQGTPLLNIFNIQYVSSEILHTLVGSFGLVTVAPFTALIGGLVYVKERIEGL